MEGQVVLAESQASQGDHEDVVESDIKKHADTARAVFDPKDMGC